MPAAASYLRRAGDSKFRAFKLDVMRIEAGLIAEITTFDAQLFPAFGLPPTLLAFPRAGTCHGDAVRHPAARGRVAARHRRGPLGERFRWLTAPRSTIVQPGPVHSGLTADPAAELTHLFDTLVRINDREF